MHFDTFSDFLAMGGYAPYVWAGVAVSLLAMLGTVVFSVVQNRQVIEMIRQQRVREQRIKAAKNMENTL